MKAITILFGAMLLAAAPLGCGGSGTGGDATGTTTDSNTTTTRATEPSEAAEAPPPERSVVATTPPITTPAPKAEPETGSVWVLLDTTMGDIVLELNAERAPITVDNFLAYVDDGFYDGTIFHRVITNFVIQGGGFTPNLVKKPTREPILNESQNGLKNKRGTISMARMTPADSATSQFFINVNDNAVLDTAGPVSGGAAYAVFGEVIAGMDVVDEIRMVPTRRIEPHDYLPLTDILIERAVRLAAEEAREYIDEGE